MHNIFEKFKKNLKNDLPFNLFVGIPSLVLGIFLSLEMPVLPLKIFFLSIVLIGIPGTILGINYLAAMEDSKITERDIANQQSIELDKLCEELRNSKELNKEKVEMPEVSVEDVYDFLRQSDEFILPENNDIINQLIEKEENPSEEIAYVKKLTKEKNK